MFLQYDDLIFRDSALANARLLAPQVAVGSTETGPTEITEEIQANMVKLSKK
jgi:hypothetical protein